MDVRKEIQQEEFTIRHRPLLDWGLEQVDDEQLQKYFNWYPVKKYIIEDGTKQLFLDDIVCGEDWWEIQVLLFNLFNARADMKVKDAIEKNHRLLCYLLYADETTTYTFNGQQFHPVYARLANLDSEVRNGYSHGGGALVGFLPMVTKAFHLEALF
jgi:hypothetical protein